MRNIYSPNNINKSAFVLFPIFLIMYELVVNLSNDMYIPASTLLVDYFRTNSTMIQLTFTSWFGGAMIVNPILGILSDNLCRKKILLSTGLFFIAASLYCAFSSDIYLFLLARFLQGAAVTTIVICGYAVVHDIYDDKHSIILISWMSGVLITAPMLGPLLGGYIIHYLDWQAIFIVLALIAFIALVGIRLFMPDKQIIDSSRKIDWINEMGVYLKILTNFNFMSITLLSAMLFGGIIAWITASPFLLISAYTYTPVEFGLAQIPIFGSYILGTLILKLALKFDAKEKDIIKAGVSIVAVVSICMYILMKVKTDSVLPLIILISIYGFVYGMISAPANRIAVKSVEFGLGKTMAIYDFTLGLAGTFATLIINVGSSNILALVYSNIATFALLSSFLYAANYIYTQRGTT